MSRLDTPTPTPSRPHRTPEWPSVATTIGGVVGATMLAGGLALLLIFFVPLVTDDPYRAEVPIDGKTHHVDVVPGLEAHLTMPNEREMHERFVSLASCQVIDSSAGPIAIPAEPAETGWAEGWGNYGAFRFNTGSGRLDLTCTTTSADEETARIGPAMPGGGPQFRPTNLLAMVCAFPLVAVGFALTITAAIRWLAHHSRQRRRVTSGGSAE